MTEREGREGVSRPARAKGRKSLLLLVIKLSLTVATPNTDRVDALRTNLGHSGWGENGKKGDGSADQCFHAQSASESTTHAGVQARTFSSCGRKRASRP